MCPAGVGIRNVWSESSLDSRTLVSLQRMFNAILINPAVYASRGLRELGTCLRSLCLSRGGFLRY